MNLPQVDMVDAAIDRLAEQLSPVDAERIRIDQCAGRILAAPILADRDSPALDVSAMDGYAVRIADVSGQPLPVSGTSPAGSPPLELKSGTAIRIFTGAPTPAGADCVVKREDTEEQDSQVVIRLPATDLAPGLNIRRQGENTAAGSPVLPAGTHLGSAAMSAVASFGTATLEVARKIRVTLLNTGDELAQAGEPVADWQIRDSNGPCLDAWLARLNWTEIVGRQRVPDQFEQVCQVLRQALEKSDAIILTGGVSMGDADYVPDAIEAIGGNIAFHRLPIRPGRPVLGASAHGKLILGLPGNPVSVAVTSRVFGRPLLAYLANRCPPSSEFIELPLVESDEKKLNLVWYRLVQVSQLGRMHLTSSQGSGDLVSLARSSGFIRVPPGEQGTGPWPFFRWD